MINYKNVYQERKRHIYFESPKKQVRGGKNIFI